MLWFTDRMRTYRIPSIVLALTGGTASADFVAVGSAAVGSAAVGSAAGGCAAGTTTAGSAIFPFFVLNNLKTAYDDYCLTYTL